MKNITSITCIALATFASAYFGFLQPARAISPAPDGAYPGGNTAEGQAALLSLTSGGYNTAVGFLALRSDVTNSFNTAVGAGTLLANTADENTAIGVAALLNNTMGSANTATGVFALANNTTGFDNTATGVDVLLDNTTGFDNTASGVGALEINTEGSENTAIGVAALEGNTTGDNNVAIGVNALLTNATGNFNTAIGIAALFSATGSHNIALGDGAGLAVTAGDNNIEIGNGGVTGESNTIHIGNDSQTAAYISGIAGQMVGMGGTTCYVDNDGKLGVFLSARRYKQNIQRMDEASAALYSLKPVTFRYKPELDNSGTPQFGLVAEEVAEVSPDLVTHNAKGELSTVRYEAVNVMLLNEFLKEHKRVQDLETNAAEQREMIVHQQQQIDALVTSLQRMNAKP